MKKAFDQNVSRARPRVRLGSAPVETETALPVEALAQAIASEPAPVIPDLASAVRARAAEAKEPKPTAVQQLRSQLEKAEVVEAKAVPAPLASPMAVEPPGTMRGTFCTAVAKASSSCGLEMRVQSVRTS